MKDAFNTSRLSVELFSIGKIVAPHSVRGDVRIIPWTDFPDRFYNLKTVYLDDADHQVSVESVRPHKKNFLVKFQGCDNMNDALALKGKILKVRREELAPLPEGHFYIFDIIGLEVFTESGESLGDVTDVLETGSNDVYVVEAKESSALPKRRQPLLIPALKEVVKKIDLANKQMIVRLQEEW